MGGVNFQLCRRQVLGLGAGIAAAGVLAGCSESTEELERGTVLADAADIAEGEAIPVLAGDTPMILTHTPGGTFRAFSAICTHQGCKVVPDAGQPEILECPCHRSEFDTYTGAVLKGPAEEDLPEFPVSVREGKIVAD